MTNLTKRRKAIISKITAVISKIKVAVFKSRNKYYLFALTLCLLYGCFDKKINIQYDSSTHTLKDLNGNSFRNISLNELNADSSIACTIYYYKKYNARSTNFINLERADTTHFEMDSSLKCNLKKGYKYLLIVKYLGKSDTLQIIW